MKRIYKILRNFCVKRVNASIMMEYAVVIAISVILIGMLMPGILKHLKKISEIEQLNLTELVKL